MRRLSQAICGAVWVLVCCAVAIAVTQPDTLQVRATSGATVYVVVFNVDGDAYQPATNVFAAYTGDHADNDLALTEIGTTGRYLVEIPDGVGGLVSWEMYEQAGGTPSAADDVMVAAGSGIIVSQQFVADRRLGTPTDLGSGETVAANLADVSAAFPENFVLMLVNDSGHVTGVSTLSDFNDEEVPGSRKWLLKPSSDDVLVGEETRVLAKGTAPLFAVDFRKDMATNDRVVLVEAPTIFAGTAGGVTFGVPGREDSEAKVSITGVTADTYVIEFNVTYLFGGTQKARVKLKVID